MTPRSIIAKSGIAVALAASALAGGLAAPVAAWAQPDYYGDQPPPDYRPAPYYNPCERDKTDREVAGGVLGAVGGAVIGSNLAHGGGRTGGALLGGALGAAGGAAVGGATAACDPNDYQPSAGPPPPPPPGGYGDEYYGDRDRDDHHGCAMVEDRVFFPDGTIQRGRVRACRDENGRWRVVD